MKYCTTCLYPTTKPDLEFDRSGVCSACTSFSGRADINWDERRKDFLKLVDKYSGPSTEYDCIIPVSGGKDSTYQVLVALKNGLNPLCVTGTTDDLSAIGRENIENIKSLGVDYIEYTFDPNVRRKLNRLCLEDIGDISWPEHVAIFTTPVRIAVSFNIRLIIWGENPQNEYGGPALSQESPVLDRSWLEEFGGLLGLRTGDLLDIYRIDSRSLIPYQYPSQEHLNKSGVTGIFLGHFFPWDGFQNSLIAGAHGFKSYPSTIEGSIVNYENLDNYQTGIHDYFKYLKFGFGRGTDIANNHIRRGRLSRDWAIDLIRRHDGRYPHTYLGQSLEVTLEKIGLTIEQFDGICNRFSNKNLFVSDKNDGARIKRRQDGSPQLAVEIT
jgi:N-acetyl sugar amidotransferase